MKKVIVFVVLASVAISVIACSGTPATPTKPAGTPAPAIKVTNRIVAEGKVVPARFAALSFQTPGVVTQVLVAVGERVTAGKILAQIDSKQFEFQLAQAEANFAAAQAKFNQLKRGPTPDELAAAQQSVKSAQTAYDKLIKPDANDVLSAKTDLDKAQAALKTAQSAYDSVGGDSNPNAGMLPQRLQLQNAWLDYQKAQIAFNYKITPPDAQVQQALAVLQTAKNQLAKLTPTAEDLAAAEANAKGVQAARDLATEQLARVKLVAPFDGVIASVDVKPGEQANAATPVMRIADPSNMQVETTDLTEINVVNVKVGDAVKVSFDAIPELELTGTVVAIKGFGENRQGDIVYALVIKLDKQDERLLWNMTAKVTIAK